MICESGAAAAQDSASQSRAIAPRARRILSATLPFWTCRCSSGVTCKTSEVGATRLCAQSWIAPVSNTVAANGVASRARASAGTSRRVVGLAVGCLPKNGRECIVSPRFGPQTKFIGTVDFCLTSILSPPPTGCQVRLDAASRNNAGVERDKKGFAIGAPNQIKGRVRSDVLFHQPSRARRASNRHGCRCVSPSHWL